MPQLHTRGQTPRDTCFGERKMPKVSVAVPHEMDPDEVAERAGPYIEKIVDDFQGHDLEIEWEGRAANFSFKSLTFRIKGDVAVSENDIAVNVDLPFAAMIFKDKVERAIGKNLKRAIGGDDPS
jgi:hypothetical protein